MAKKKALIESHTMNLVDPITGELFLVEDKKLVTVPTGDFEEFFQVYCRLVASVYELKYADDIKILIKFCEIAEFNTGKVTISTADRKQICEELGLHTSNFSKALKRLKDKGLVDGDKGTYTINPILFWKGDRKVRAELLKSDGLSVTFKFKV